MNESGRRKHPDFVVRTFLLKFFFSFRVGAVYGESEMKERRDKVSVDGYKRFGRDSCE